MTVPQPSEPVPGGEADREGGRVHSDDAPGGASDSVRPGPSREARDAELRAEGWTRRFVGSPPRLDEMVELYESLGRDVLLDPLSDEELAAECRGCTLALSLFRVVYTRPAEPGTSRTGGGPGKHSARRPEPPSPATNPKPNFDEEPRDESRRSPS